jgi:hypothetical protein
MKKTIGTAIALCAGLGLLIGAADAGRAQNAPAADAAGAEAPAKPAVKPHKAKAKGGASATATIIVTNKRAVALTSLDAAQAGGEPVTILKALAPGKKATARVKHGKDCAFDLHGAFEDGSTTDMPGVDLCKEKTFNLVE